MRANSARHPRNPTYLLLACVAGACAGDDHAADEPAPDTAALYGGTAVVAISIDPPTFNGLAAVDWESMAIHQGILSMPLVRYDESLQPQPWLAERWDTVRVTSDTLELTFHLRRDVRWHDGTQTTAEDVRFTYERMFDPQVAFPRRGFLDHWSPHIVIPDSFTIRFRLRAHAEFLDFWTWDVVLPAHLLRGVPPAELRTHHFAHRPVGNGPFRFQSRQPGRQLVFEANPEFPEALGGRPYLDRIVFRVIPEATARLTELLTGGVDLGFIPPEQGAGADSAGLRSVTFPSGMWTQIAWNTRRPPFDDVRVRRAFSLAIDRRELVDGVMYGYAEPGRWTVTPAHWPYDTADAQTAPRYDPDAAARLLARAGWADRDGDGILDRNGQPLRFTLLILRESSTHPRSGVAIQAQLRRIGVDMQIRMLEEATAFSLAQGRLDDRGERVRDFDALLTNYTTGRSSDDSWFLHSRNRNNPLSLPGYADPRADALMEALAVTLDRDAARPLWRDYQRLMVRESPVAVLLYPYFILAHGPRLDGVDADGTRHAFLSAPRWRIVRR